MKPVSFMPFQNESDCFEIGGITIENRLDRVSIFGSTEITKDLAGLEQALMLKRLIDGVINELKRERGNLPEHIETITAEIVDNPFK